MKKTITLLAILSVVNVFATDRVVNPNLSQGNGTTVFVTITDAVAAAQNGDRIIITSSSYNEGILTIDKSLQITPQNPGEIINFNSDIVISGFIGMKLEIIGFDLGNYSFITNPLNNNSSNASCAVSLVDVQANNIDFNEDYYLLNLINSNLINDLTFKNGTIVLSSMNNCYIRDETGSNTDDNKTKIIQNDISNDLYVFNDNREVLIANNNLNNLIVQKWVLDLEKTNYIINNEFANDTKVHFASHEFNSSNGGLNNISFLAYNFRISNNIFSGIINYTAPNFVNNSPWSRFQYGNDYYDYSSVEQIDFSTSNCLWPNPNANGFFEWSYNYVNIPSWTHSFREYNTEKDGGILSFTNILGTSSIVDSGSPNHNYYDIDLTINDRGINGGPYSQLNYNASNPNNSRAFIFDLEMPADLFPGENIEIKAQGYHSN